MKFGPIRSIVIDDKPAHLMAIAAGLAAVGIPCMPYWYNRGRGSLVPQPQSPHKYLRLIFCDLNLAEMGGNPEPAALEGVIEDVLRQVVAPDGGPYVLVFWTEVTGKVTSVRTLLYERLAGIPLPLAIVELTKAPFLPRKSAKAEDLEVALQKMYADLSRKLPALGREILKLSAIQPELNVVAEWESRAIEAAAGAINEIVEHARTDAADKAKVGETLKNLLGFIGIAAAGAGPAAAQPARALDSGMAEILIDRFSGSVDEKTYRKLVADTLGAVISGPPTFTNRSRIASALNKFFHVDMNIEGVKANERGVVIPGTKHMLVTKLGMTHAQLLQTEFLFPAKQTPDGQALYAALPGDAKLVLIETGADCDHAQPKPRSIRYLVGFEVPKKYKDLLISKSNKPNHPSLTCLGPWLVLGSEVYLIVSTRRFITWQHSKPPSDRVRYRLRTALVNKLLHDYSTWHSRPGIVEFRP
jgi:hypothetical protein